MELGPLRDIERSLRNQCEALDPDSVVLADVLALFRSLESMVRLAEGAKLRLARKVEAAGCHRIDGSRDTAEFLARATGTTVGAARQVLATSERLAAQPHTDRALAEGNLSSAQAVAVTDAVAADPTAEATLLASARCTSLRQLRDRCATTKANAHADDGARREAIRRARSCRTWTDAEGAWNLALRHLPEVGAEIEALLAPYTHARWDAARTAGTHEPRAAYRADGLLDLARATATALAPPKGARRVDTKIFVHIDAETLLSGRRRPGSVCEIDGLGPVDVEWVRGAYGEAFAVALIEDGNDICRLVHLGRQVTAHQRSALEARGYRCEVPGCAIAWGLEIDHDADFAIARVTTVDDLSWKCDHHHDLHTHHGYRLTGPVGRRTWTAGDGTVIARDPLHATAPIRPPPPTPAAVTHDRQPTLSEALQGCAE